MKVYYKNMNEQKDTQQVKACGECDKMAHLHVFPSDLAGIYECPFCGSSWACEHPDTHSDADVDGLAIDVCDDCGLQVTEL